MTRMFRTYLDYKIINQLLLLFMLLMLPSTVYAIDVEETIWGFNNQPVRGKFVPLSLRLSNNTPEVFDEAVQLNRQQFNGTKVGAPLYKKVYLPPYSSQWVQFYPYIVDGQDEDWSLNWGPGFVQYRSVKRTGGTVTTTGPLRIIIAGSDGLLQGGDSFKKYPEDLFPPFVTATDSLDEVILGHVPRWDVARRVSFMDWLEQGGILHLLPDPSGESLKFTSNLAPLNAPFDHFRVGAGLVIRHNSKLNQLKATTLDERIQAVRDSEAKSLGIYASAPLANESQSSGENYDPYQYGDINSGFLYQLSELTRPTHNWAVIYIMTLFYILLIFPGCYLFQHRKNMMRYRNSLLFLLCTVSLFSIIFWTIGKRGYGEKTTINSVLLAKPLPDNQLDLTCWMNCFVTEGDDYQFTEDGEGAIFSTAQVIERVRGGIFNGNDGRFVSDIPPFSSRRMIYRIKAPYTSPRFSVQDYEIDMENGNVILKQLTLKSETPLPPGLNHRQLLLGKYVYDLIPSSGENPSELSLGKSRELLSAWNRHLDSDLLYASRLRTANSDADIEQVYDGLRTHLILKDLGLLSSEKLQQYQGNSSRLQLFLYGEIPETLKVKTNVQGTQQGRILFAYNLALPEKKNLTNDK